MRKSEIVNARRLLFKLVGRFGPAWSLTLLVMCVDAVWLVFGGWSVSGRNVAALGLAAAAFFAPLAFGRYRRELRIATTLRAAALLIVFQAAAATLSYLVISTGAGLVDAPLAACDRALGFDWLALHAWLRSHPFAQTALHIAYNSGLVQLVFVLLFLGLSARPERLAEFMRLFIVATLLNILVSGPFPAAGTWKHYAVGEALDLSTLSHFELLRSGQLHEIPLGQMQGLISIPSLHAAMAVLIVNAMRGTLVFPLFVVLNAAMLASTPIDGGHYLVDVVAGVALALGLIALSRKRSAHTHAHAQQAEPGLNISGLGALHR